MIRSRAVRAGAVCACAAAMAGCLYVKPGWVPTNLPPDIDLPPNYDGQVIPIVLDRNIALTVIANDPEGEPLGCRWTVNVVFPLADPSVTTDINGRYVFTQNVPPDPLLYGATITALVTDPVNSVPVIFQMVEPSR